MPKPIVLDASAWLAVLLKEEGSSALEDLLEHRTLLAPELIRYETANGVLYAKRSGRAPFKKIPLEDIFEIIWEFPIQTIPMDVWWHESLRLVQRYDITFYDAAYVGIAVALKIPLLTLDKKILKLIKPEKLETATGTIELYEA